MATYQEFSARRASLNAALLMFRSVITIIIGLVTSRIIFNALGVENYGINAVVGGMLPAFTFIGGILAAATSRFLTYEIGRGDEKSIKETFIATFWTHLSLAIVLVVICEIGGLYLLKNHLNIPLGRENAAMIVLQCSIIGMFFTTTQTPYQAILVAREQFKVYAYVSLAAASFSLVSAFLVKYSETDKLILYVFLGALNGIASTLYLRFYCIRHFREAHLERNINFKRLKPILIYTSWELFGHFCATLYSQSRNYLVNIFFGVSYNSSTNVATTVSGSVNSFVSPVLSAFAPSVTKQYAQNNIPEMQRAMKTTMRFSLLVFVMFAVPIWFNAETLFQLWLGTIPEAAPDVLRCILLAIFAELMSAPFNIGINATGKMQRVSIFGGLYVICLFFIIYWLYSTYHYYLHAFIVLAVGSFIEVFMRALILKKQLSEISIKPIIMIIGQFLILVCLTAMIPYLMKIILKQGVTYLILSTAIYIPLFGSTAYFTLLNRAEQATTKQYLSSILHRFNKGLKTSTKNEPN